MGENLISDGFRDELRRLVQQSRQQVETQRAQAGWGGPAPQRPFMVGPVAFELHDDVTPGSTDKYVWLLNADYTRNTSAGYATVKVSDEVLRDVRAYGSNHGGWSGSPVGAKGWYIPGTDGKNQIISIQRLAKMIRVGIGTGCVSANATFTPTSLAVMDCGQDPSNGGGTYPTVTNYSTAIGNSGAGTSGIICAWDEAGGHYLVIDAPCPVGC